MSTQPAKKRQGAPAVPKALLGLLVGLVVLLVVLVWALSALSPTTPGEQVSLDEARRALADGQIREATVYTEDSRVVLETTEEQLLWAALPEDGAFLGQLIGELSEAGARVSVEQQWGRRTLALFAQFILPLLILANLFGIFILLARGGSGQVKDLFAFSKMSARRAQAAEQNPYRFSDVAAVSGAVEELQEIADYLRNPQRFAAMGALPPKGVLLYGPPGCGKTLLARALAGEVGVPFYYLSGSEFVESLVGVGAARVRDLFRQAVATAPAIVFVDELDAAGRKRGAGVGGGHDEREQTLNEILVQMDGFAPTLGVVVIGATNRPDILDPALLRPGRFDRHVGLEAPDAQGRLEILRLHAHGRRIGAGVDLGLIAKATPGFTGADLANVLNEAALLAIRRGASVVEQQDLAEGAERVLAGPKRQGRLLTPEEVSRIAYHEAGHAVTASGVDFPMNINRVSIVSRGREGTHTSVPRSDRTVLTRGELLDELTVSMGGLAAEILFTGEPSTAAEADLEHATDLARRIAGRYGMSEEVGRIRILQPDAEVFLGRDLTGSQQISSETLQAVDEAVGHLVGQAEERALDILQRRRSVLDKVANALIDQESLDEAELIALLGDTQRAPQRRRKATARR